MKLKFPYILIFFAILIASCGESQSKLVTKSIVKSEKIASDFDTLGITKEIFQSLLTEGDHIDIIFNNLPLSMNQDGNTAIYQDLQYLSARPLKSLNTNCTPLARKIYLSKGEIIMEGDLYYSPECYFQVFIKDGKELYGNYLTEKGVAFIGQLLKQAKAKQPGQ